MTREDAIELLVDFARYFDRDDIGTPAMEFWIKDLMEMKLGTECYADIDRHAWLNTLFGYDIGFYPAMKIDHWLWGSEDENGEYRDIETLDIGYKDKPLIQQCVKELGLDLSFDKWATKEPAVYQYRFELKGESEMKNKKHIPAKAKLIPVTIYCDSTKLFSETECDTNNLTDMLFPEWIVEAWYLINERFFAPECKAEGYKPNVYNWYREIYTADDTIGLYDFAVAKGYDPVFDSGNTQNAVVYENLEYDTVVAFTGTTMECRKWAREHDWKFTIGYGDTEVDLEMLFHQLEGETNEMTYNYPTAEGIKFAMEEGWTREQAERGFEIFDFDGLGLLEIEAICDCYPDQIYDDEAAAKEAERIGYCKIIPVDELPDPFIINEADRRYFGWVDTLENRKRIEKFVEEENK